MTSNPAHVSAGVITGAEETTLDNVTLQAYLKAEYRVLATPAFSLRVGERSPELQHLYQTTPARTAAFITPYNPLGHLLSAHENLLRLQTLEARLAHLGLTSLRVKGLDPDGKWPEEEGVLVLGISQSEAIDLGREFRQNAILWCDADARVRLVLLV